MTAIERAIEILGSKAELARACGQPRQAATRWVKDGRVPAKHCKAIEAATRGRVTCHELLPDVFPAPAKGRAA